jgi:hypothetical protein
MDAQTLHSRLEEIFSQNDKRALKNRVAIVVHRPGSVGGTPTVNITDVEVIEIVDAHKGIDWNSNVIMLSLASEVSTLSVEQRDAITENMRRGQTVEAFEQYKSLHAKIDLLKRLLGEATPAYHAALSADEHGQEKLDAFNAAIESLKPPARR